MKVKEIFRTLQGEGYHAGTAAVFVRFAGCNLWSGHERHRERDAAGRGASCPRWCDTDFVGGTAYDEAGLVDAIAGLAEPTWTTLVVFTGGEPALQLNESFLCALAGKVWWAAFHVETNGTAELPLGLDWVTLSPKVPLDLLITRKCDELKVVVPAYDPGEYAGIAAHHRFVQPQDGARGSVGWAVRYCLAHPEWRLSLQTHKLLGLP